jgi:chemotaxis protein MotB
VRKPKAAPHENHERWLVSYADFITLLFAFFVVMFATAQKDKSKQQEVAQAVREAFQHGQLTAAITGIINQKTVPPDGKGDTRQNPPSPPPPPPQGPPATHADLVKTAEKLQKALEPELKSGKLSIEINGRGLIISLREAAFFASGDDAVSPSSFSILEKIAPVIQAITNPVRLEGHTDSVPIHTSRFRSNWELSTARGIAMLELLREKYQYPNERMSVTGFAENAPADTNETAEGRAHNRRVDLVVVSAEALSAESPTAPAKK